MRLILFFALLSFCVGADLYVVNKDGSTSYSAIQDAIDSASDGDTILVEAGTYPENIDFDGKDIILLSHFCYDESPDSTFLTSTIIVGHNGENRGPVVTFDSGESTATLLCGFTIQNGYEDSTYSYGGGIRICGWVCDYGRCTGVGY